MEKALTPLRKYRAKVILAPFLKLFEVATELLSPFLVRFIIDNGIEKNDYPYALKLSLIMLSLSVVGFGVTMLAQYLAARVSADYGYDLREKVYAHLSSLSEKELDRFGKKKILTLVNNDCFSMQNGVMMFMRLLLRPPFLLLGSVILAFVIAPWAGGILLGAIGASFLVLLGVMAIAPKKYAAIQANLDEVSGLASDSLKGARPIRAFEKADYEEKKFQKSLTGYKEKNMGMAFYNAFINPLTFGFINLGLILVVYFGKIQIAAGTLTTGAIVSLIQYLVSSLAALVMWSRMIVSLNKANASRKRIDDFLRLEPSVRNQGGSANDISANPALIEFDDVALSYGNKADKPAVSHLSFRIEKGQWIGLIGGTGSGKSTTLALLERLYEPTAGTILYKGAPLERYNLERLHQEIALVSQKPSLFRGSVRSNLLLGKKDASEEMVVQALKDSLAYEFVSQYPDFLEHPIEEGGANLSGGQKQRLLIARALLKGGEILILDDATSALDFLSDQKVRANIAERPALTKILVSQRASSLKNCDRILVYENGTIIAQGRHEELLASCAVYQEIVAMQRRQA